MNASEAGSSERDPAGTPYREHCPVCGGETVHNSHYRCIECGHRNERVRVLYTDSERREDQP